MSVVNERMEFRRTKKQPIFSNIFFVFHCWQRQLWLFSNIKTKGTHSFDVRTRSFSFIVCIFFFIEIATIANWANKINNFDFELFDSMLPMFSIGVNSIGAIQLVGIFIEKNHVLFHSISTRNRNHFYLNQNGGCVRVCIVYEASKVYQNNSTISFTFLIMKISMRNERREIVLVVFGGFGKWMNYRDAVRVAWANWWRMYADTSIRSPDAVSLPRNVSVPRTNGCRLSEIRK